MTIYTVIGYRENYHYYDDQSLSDFEIYILDNVQLSPEKRNFLKN